LGCRCVARFRVRQSVELFTYLGFQIRGVGEMYIRCKMPLKTIVLIALFALIGFTSFGQNEPRHEGGDCFALRLSRKKNVRDTALFTANYNRKGFYVLKNGVYDFRVSSHQYFFHRVLSITRDSILICPAFDSTKSFSFPVSSDFYIRLLSFDDDGLAGFNEIISRWDYFFDVVPQKQYCQIQHSKICLDSNCSRSISGYYYFTAGLRCWKALYQEDGRTYIRDGSELSELNKHLKIIKPRASR
jgi:hypothetical protein